MLFVVFKIVGDSMYNSIYILILAGVHGQAGLAVAVLCVAGGGKLSVSTVQTPDDTRQVQFHSRPPQLHTSPAVT